MSAPVLGELDARQTITRLVAMGVSQLLGLVADITAAESDRLLMTGDRQKATLYMRDLRIVQRAVEMLHR